MSAGSTCRSPCILETAGYILFDRGEKTPERCNRNYGYFSTRLKSVFIRFSRNNIPGYDILFPFLINLVYIYVSLFISIERNKMNSFISSKSIRKRFDREKERERMCKWLNAARSSDTGASICLHDGCSAGDSEDTRKRRPLGVSDSATFPRAQKRPARRTIRLLPFSSGVRTCYCSVAL